MQDRLWTKKELAEFFQRSVRSIDAAIAANDIPFIRISRSIRFDPQAIHKWVDEHSVESVGRSE